jgi:hypothetical protein
MKKLDTSPAANPILADVATLAASAGGAGTGGRTTPTQSDPYGERHMGNRTPTQENPYPGQRQYNGEYRDPTTGEIRPTNWTQIGTDPNLRPPAADTRWMQQYNYGPYANGGRGS